MPKQRSPEREKAFELYKQGLKLIEIAKELNLPEGTIRGWKNKDKWDDKLNGTFRKIMERSNGTMGPEQKRKEIEKLDLDDADLTEKQKLFCLYYIKNFNATQAYLKAYGCAYTTALVEGSRSLLKPNIKKEIERLKEIKRQTILIGEDDIVERYMRIAFADMTDFVEFSRVTVPIMTMFGPMKEKDPITGKEKIVTKEVNEVRFKGSDIVDGGLICEVKQGKDGASIKLEDRQKALDWLSNFFGMNPQHKHAKWYDEQRIKLAEKELDHKISAGNNMENAILQSQEKIKTLADLINNPKPNRHREDFEENGENER